MTAETLTAPEEPSTVTTTEEVVAVDVPVAEKTIEAEPAPVPAEEAAAAAELEKELAASVSFKEETNVVGELPESQKKALDALKQLVQEALNKHELAAPPLKKKEKPIAVVEVEAEAPKVEEKPEETTPPLPAEEAAVPVEAAMPVEPKKTSLNWSIPKVSFWGKKSVTEVPLPEEPKEETATTEPAPVAEEVVTAPVVEEEVVTAPVVEEEAAIAPVLEETKEEVVTAPAAAEPKKKKPLNWGIPKVSLNWSFPKKTKAPVVEEPKKEEEATKEEVTAPAAEETKEEVTALAAETPAEEITILAAKAPKEEIAILAPETSKDETTVSVTEETRKVITVPAIEAPKEEITIRAPEETKEEVTAPAAEEPKDKEVISESKEELTAPAAVEAPPLEPEEVSIWGVTLLSGEKSDVLLLKFLRARDFKVKEALAMLRNTVRWQREFGLDAILEEDLGTELEKVVYISGIDKEGHPVCYNVYGEFKNKELYQSTFADSEKPEKFLRWRIQFLEKTIRKDLDLSPDGVCTFVQVNDLKDTPGPFKRELKIATDQAVQLFQDNYPEFVAKQVFINVPWLYLAFYKVISPFFTQRTKSKFVFAGPSKSAETLFKYIAPEQVPVQYGGLSKDGEQDFTTADTATEEIIKPSTKTTIELPCSEASTLVWQARVIGWDVLYGAEFVPSAERGYTVIIQKLNKISPADETVLSGSYKATEAGKMVLTFDNSASSKKKKLLYRSKTKSSE